MGCGTSSDQLHSLSTPQSTSSLRYYTPADLALHARPSSAWTVIDGRVLDVTAFGERHPGGSELLELAAWGKDASRHFSAPPNNAEPFAHAHSAAAREMLHDLQVGILVPEDDPRAGRLLVDVEAEERARHQQAGNAYGGAGGGAPLRAQAVQRIKQVQRAGREAEAAAAAAAARAHGPSPVAHAAHPPVLRAFSAAEVATHSSQGDCWTVAMDGQVFDLTSLVNRNPAAAGAAARSRSPSRSSGSSSPTAPPALLDWRKLGGKNGDAYLRATLTEDQMALFLPPLQVGYLHGHSVQPEDAGRMPGAHSHPHPQAGRGGKDSPALQGRAGPTSSSLLSSSALATAALDGIASDGLTVAAAEGLLASPSPVRFLWTLADRRDLSPDTVLLVLEPVTAPSAIRAWENGRSGVERELQLQYPVTYSTSPLRPGLRLGQHFSVEVPLALPLENPAERLERERENRPLDVPFRMQRSYTPLEAGAGAGAGAAVGEEASVSAFDTRNPLAITLAVKSYPTCSPPAPGSAYMHSLDIGDTLVTTGARGGRLGFETLAASGAYDVWVGFVAGSGVTAVFAIVKELLERIAKATAASNTAAAAVAAVAAGKDGHQQGGSSPFAAHSPSSAASSTATTNTAAHVSESVLGSHHHGGGGSVVAAPSSQQAPLAPVVVRRARAASTDAAPSSSGAPRDREPLPPGFPCKRVVLVCCNRTEEDILLGAELDALVEKHSAYFQLFHVLSRPIFSPKHSSFTGRLGADVMRFVLPPCLHPVGMGAASVSFSGGVGGAGVGANGACPAGDAVTGAVGALLAGGGGGMPGSRPRSPSSAQPRPDVRDISARVHAAQLATGLGLSGGSMHASPLLMPMQGVGSLPSLPSSCPGSRPRSPSRFTFNSPSSRPSRSPLLASAPPPPLAVPPIPALPSRGVSGAGTIASTSGGALPVGSPELSSVHSGSGGGGSSAFSRVPAPLGSPTATPGVQDLLHVPERLRHVNAASPSMYSTNSAVEQASQQLTPMPHDAASLHQDGTGGGGTAMRSGLNAGVGAALAAQQRLTINAGGVNPPLSLHPSARARSGSLSTAGAAAPTGPHAARSTGLALVCGPLEFAQDTLALLVRFGFKRGIGNLGGKDVHVF